MDTIPLVWFSGMDTKWTPYPRGMVSLQELLLPRVSSDDEVNRLYRLVFKDTEQWECYRKVPSNKEWRRRYI